MGGGRREAAPLAKRRETPTPQTSGRTPGKSGFPSCTCALFGGPKTRRPARARLLKEKRYVSLLRLFREISVAPAVESVTSSVRLVCFVAGNGARRLWARAARRCLACARSRRTRPAFLERDSLETVAGDYKKGRARGFVFAFSVLVPRRRLDTTRLSLGTVWCLCCCDATRRPLSDVCLSQSARIEILKARPGNGGGGGGGPSGEFFPLSSGRREWPLFRNARNLSNRGLGASRKRLARERRRGGCVWIIPALGLKTSVASLRKFARSSPPVAAHVLSRSRASEFLWGGENEMKFQKNKMKFQRKNETKFQVAPG